MISIISTSTCSTHKMILHTGDKAAYNLCTICGKRLYMLNKQNNRSNSNRSQKNMQLSWMADIQIANNVASVKHSAQLQTCTNCQTEFNLYAPFSIFSMCTPVYCATKKLGGNYASQLFKSLASVCGDTFIQNALDKINFRRLQNSSPDMAVVMDQVLENNQVFLNTIKVKIVTPMYWDKYSNLIHTERRYT